MERGADNHLTHVRALFEARFGLAEVERKGGLSQIAVAVEVDPNTLRRVFRSRTWTRVPNAEVLDELATILHLDSNLVLFAFIGDLHPKAFDAGMRKQLAAVGLMSPVRVAKLRKSVEALTG